MEVKEFGIYSIGQSSGMVNNKVAVWVTNDLQLTKHFTTEEAREFGDYLIGLADDIDKEEEDRKSQEKAEAVKDKRASVADNVPSIYLTIMEYLDNAEANGFAFDIGDFWSDIVDEMEEQSGIPGYNKDLNLHKSTAYNAVRDWFKERAL